MDVGLALKCQALEDALMKAHAENNRLIQDIGQAWQGEDAAVCTRFLHQLGEHMRDIAGRLRLLSQG